RPDAISCGDFARHLFIYGGLYDRLRYPTIACLRLPFVKPILGLAHLYRWFPTLAPVVRATYGKSLRQPLTEIAVLGIRHHLDAQAYYMFELYRSENMREARGYLTRFETKNGLFKALNVNFQRRDKGQRSKLGNKLRFNQTCLTHQLATVPLLLTVKS